MARKKLATPIPSVDRPAVTAERFERLHRLLNLLGQKPRTREDLIQSLGLDVRGFYRDLELLRTLEIDIGIVEGKYRLAAPPEGAQARLPFPDLHITLGEARQLARGRTALHKRIQELIARACTS